MTNFVKATNFRAKDALVTGDPNKRIKGAEIDDEFNAIATAIGSKADLASPSFTGTPTAPTPANGDNSSKVATTAFVFSNSVPVGAILMWSGLVSAIPSGYAICDGTSGTPDLRDRMVIGAGTTYAVGATGGSKDAVVVEHTHTLTDPGHFHQQTNNGPDVDTGTLATGTQSSGTQYASLGTVNSSANTLSKVTGITINTTGESATNKNLPPYYALAFIQRVS